MQIHPTHFLLCSIFYRFDFLTICHSLALEQQQQLKKSAKGPTLFGVAQPFTIQPLGSCSINARFLWNLILETYHVCRK